MLICGEGGPSHHIASKNYAGVETPATIKLADAPTKDNYEFQGWTDEQGGAEKKWDAGSEQQFIKKENTVYAVWKSKNVCILTFPEWTETPSKESYGWEHSTYGMLFFNINGAEYNLKPWYVGNETYGEKLISGHHYELLDTGKSLSISWSDAAATTDLPLSDWWDFGVPQGEWIKNFVQIDTNEKIWKISDTYQFKEDIKRKMWSGSTMKEHYFFKVRIKCSECNTISNETGLEMYYAWAD